MMNIATKGAAKEYADGKILSSVSDGIGILTFNNPEKRNAMSVEMWEGAAEVLTAFRDDPNVRVVVLVGAGGKAFVSGADISQFEKNRRSTGNIRAHGTGNAPHGASESVASLVMSTEIVGHRGCRGQALRRSSRRRRRRRLDAVALARRGWLLGRCPSLADYVRGLAITCGGARRRSVLMLPKLLPPRGSTLKCEGPTGELFMKTLYAPGQMQSDLGDDLRRQANLSRKRLEEVVRMFGIVFARPELDFVKREILPQLEYFNLRAGKTVTFYFAGYKAERVRRSAVAIVDGQRWQFDTKAFDEVRKYVENKSSWKYSGGTDLILTNARFVMEHESRLNEVLPHVEIDFSSAISVELKQMLSKKAIQSVGSYFEEIFRYAEKQDGIDPTWGFSDSKGVASVLSALKALVLSLLPKPLRPEVEKAVLSAVHDLRRRKPAEA